MNTWDMMRAQGIDHPDAGRVGGAVNRLLLAEMREKETRRTAPTCATCGDTEEIIVNGDQTESCPDCTSGIEGRCRECGDILNGHDDSTICLACHIQAHED